MEAITNQRQAIRWVLSQTDATSADVDARFESPCLAVEVAIDKNQQTTYRFLRASTWPAPDEPCPGSDRVQPGH